MKIKSTARPTKEPEDIGKLIEQFSQEYNNVFVEDFGGDLGVFIFHSVGRKDFRDLAETKLVSDFAKEEVLCESCTLYPRNFDFANCEEAGFPTKYSKIILEKSLLLDGDQLVNAIHYCRNKVLTEIEEQITCIIHEAFPEFSIEEISNWDVARTAEYMAKSEFILHNLRGVPLTPVGPVETKASQKKEPAKKTEKKKDPPSMEERFKEISLEDAMKQTKQEPQKEREKKKGQVLMPEGLDQLKRLCPDIDWEHDSITTHGIKALQNQDVDDRPFADRALDGSDYNDDLIPEALRSRFKVIREVKES